MSEATKGVLYAIAAYGCWGIVAIYFKAIRHVPPLQVLAHRIVWSVVILVVIVTAFRRWAALIGIAKNRRSLRLLAISTFLVAGNWYVFIWAVSNNHLTDASLGYFMTPLVNVVLGFLVLRERLRTAEWVSVALAAIAVTWLAIASGVFPWISLALAATFGLYGLVRKIASVPSIEGLTIETAILFPIALAYLIQRDALTIDPLLIASGPITALPLVWFASAVQRLRLATIGLLQYLSPTLQFVIAVFLFDEPFTSGRLAAFVLIWFAILIYSSANLSNGQRVSTRGRSR